MEGEIGEMDEGSGGPRENGRDTGEGLLINRSPTRISLSKRIFCQTGDEGVECVSEG